MLYFVFFFKQKTAYDMRISGWSSDVCSSDLGHRRGGVFWLGRWRGDRHRRAGHQGGQDNCKDRKGAHGLLHRQGICVVGRKPQVEVGVLVENGVDVGVGVGNDGRRRDRRGRGLVPRSEEHTSELQSLMRISYAVFCLKKKK